MFLFCVRYVLSFFIYALKHIFKTLISYFWTMVKWEKCEYLVLQMFVLWKFGNILFSLFLGLHFLMKIEHGIIVWNEKIKWKCIRWIFNAHPHDNNNVGLDIAICNWKLYVVFSFFSCHGALAFVWWTWACLVFLPICFFLHGESIASTNSCEDRAIIHYVSPIKALVEDDHDLL